MKSGPFLRLLAVFALPGCTLIKPGDQSQVAITNGILDLGDPGVVMIEKYSLTTGSISRCTASMLAPRILLTAAHCIKGHARDALEPMRTISAQPSKMIDYRTHPHWEYKARFDVALIKLDREVQGGQPMVVSEVSPKEGEWVRLVGFGAHEFGDAKDHGQQGKGIKRTGKSKVTGSDDHFIYTLGLRTAGSVETGQPNGINVGLGHGDSGGPMLNHKGEIVGIAAQVNAKHLDATIPLSLIGAHTQIGPVLDFIHQSMDELTHQP